MKTEYNEAAREQATLKKEQAYIRKVLGVPEDEEDSAQETGTSAQEGDMSSCDELEEDSDRRILTCPKRTTSVMSSDGGYVSSSDDDKSEDKTKKCVSFVVDMNPNIRDVNNDKLLQNLPPELQHWVAGLDRGLPDDYNVPINKKPDWLDMKKFKIGQTFAQKYYFGLNYAEMLSLLILFAFPDGLQPLIFTDNSGTPFTAFKRYLSTALRVKSWFEHDVWTEGNLGFKNLKTVRAMHLNVSKRLNSVPYSELKQQLTYYGSQNDNAVWCTLKDKITDDFKSCPFQNFRPVEGRPGKVFISQLDMSITQFGFVGLMIMFPEKFGAASATEEELDGFVHLWRGLGYLLGIEDKINLCSGSLQEVRARCRFLVDFLAKPSFRELTEDWEHMSRCLVEGISYYTPGLSFEPSLLYLCWILDLPAPHLRAAMSWWQHFMFNVTRMTMCFTLRLPGMLPLHNWLVRRSLTRASAFPPERLQKLQDKTYSYQTQGKFNTRL